MFEQWTPKHEAEAQQESSEVCMSAVRKVEGRW